MLHLRETQTHTQSILGQKASRYNLQTPKQYTLKNHDYLGVDYISPWENSNNYQTPHLLRKEYSISLCNTDSLKNTLITPKIHPVSSNSRTTKNKNKIRNYTQQNNHNKTAQIKMMQQARPLERSARNKEKPGKIEGKLINSTLNAINSKQLMNTGFGDILYRKMKTENPEETNRQKLQTKECFRDKKRLKELKEFNRVFGKKNKQKCETVIIDLNKSAKQFYEEELKSMSIREKLKNYKMNNQYERSLRITNNVTHFFKGKNIPRPIFQNSEQSKSKSLFGSPTRRYQTENSLVTLRKNKNNPKTQITQFTSH